VANKPKIVIERLREQRHLKVYILLFIYLTKVHSNSI